MQQLDRDDRREYEQAVESNPRLVQDETPFLFFLQTEQFNLPLAAARLARYWKFRKDLFGKDRWLLRMTQTGNGALDMHDVEYLRSGFCLLLDRPGDSPPIILCDLSRVAVHDSYREARVAFYMAQAYRDLERLCTGDGMPIVHIVTSAPRPSICPDPTCVRAITMCLPFRVNGVIVIQSYEEGRQHLIDYLAYMQARLSHFRLGEPAPRSVAGQSVADTLRNAQQRGIPPGCLPVQLGGGYSYDSFQDWVRMRISLEEIMSSAPVRANVVPQAVAEAAAALPAQAAKQEGKEEETEEDTKVGTTSVLQGNISESPAHQEFPLPSESPPTAAAAAAAASPATTPTDTTLASSRRKSTSSPIDFYQRRNQNIRMLQDQIKELQAQNEAIRRDNRQLESALGRARLMASLLDNVNQQNE